MGQRPPGGGGGGGRRGRVVVTVVAITFDDADDSVPGFVPFRRWAVLQAFRPRHLLFVTRVAVSPPFRLGRASSTIIITSSSNIPCL